MTVTFERASDTDANDFLNVQRTAFDNPIMVYPGIEMVIRKIQQDDAYKIALADQLIGGIVVCNQGDGHFHLDMMFLSPDYHNQGIGTQAMQFLEQTYPAQKWTLDTPALELRNRHFYEKLGYVMVGQTEYEHITLIAYEKQI